MADPLSGLIPQLSATQIINTIFYIILGILFIGGLGFGLWYMLYKRKYSQFRIEIFDKDSNGKTYKTYDRGGVFLKKDTGFRLLFLERAKVGLNPNNIPYVSTLDRKGRVIKTVYLQRIGVNNYRFINFEIGENPQISVGEEDLNNAHQEMVKIRRSFNKESWLSKLAPYMLFIISILVTMIVLISLFNKMEVIKDAAKSLDDASDKQLKVAEYYYNSTGGYPRNSQIIVGGGT